MAAANVTNGRARAEGGQTNAWAPDPSATGAALGRARLGGAAAIQYGPCRLPDRGPGPAAIYRRDVGGRRWRAVAAVDRNRHRRHVLGLDRQTAAKLRIALNEPRGICEVRVYDEPERLVEIARRAHQNMRLPDAGPWLPWDQGKPPEEWSSGAAAASRGIPLDKAATRFGGIVLDASQAELTGQWNVSTHSTPYLGDDYLTDGNGEKGASRSVSGRVCPIPARTRSVWPTRR